MTSAFNETEPLNEQSITNRFLGHTRELWLEFGEVERDARRGDFAQAADRFALFERALRRHLFAEEQITLGHLSPSSHHHTVHKQITNLLEEIGQLLACSEGITEQAVLLRNILAEHAQHEERDLRRFTARMERMDVPRLRQEVEDYLLR